MDANAISAELTDYQNKFPCLIRRKEQNVIILTAPDSHNFEYLLEMHTNHNTVVAFREMRIEWNPAKYTVSWKSVPWDGETEFLGRVVQGILRGDPNCLPVYRREDGAIWWQVDDHMTHQPIRVVLPSDWILRFGKADLVRASDGEKIGKLLTARRQLVGPNGQNFTDISATVAEGDMVVRYETGQNGRTTSITIPLPSGSGTHTFMWNGDHNGSRGAENLPKGWFYGIGRQLGKEARFGNSGSEVSGQPASGHGTSDFGSSSLRVVSRETYEQLVAAAVKSK